MRSWRCCVDTVLASDEQRIRFRIGINLRDVIADGEDIFGDGVNVAARLELKDDVAAFTIAEIAQALPERVEYRRALALYRSNPYKIIPSIIGLALLPIQPDIKRCLTSSKTSPSWIPSNTSAIRRCPILLTPIQEIYRQPALGCARGIPIDC